MAKKDQGSRTAQKRIVHTVYFIIEVLSRLKMGSGFDRNIIGN